MFSPFSRVSSYLFGTEGKYSTATKLWAILRCSSLFREPFSLCGDDGLVPSRPLRALVSTRENLTPPRDVENINNRFYHTHSAVIWWNFFYLFIVSYHEPILEEIFYAYLVKKKAFSTSAPEYTVPTGCLW